MNTFRKILNAIRGTDRIKEEVKKELGEQDETLTLFLQATWCQKQLDDLLLMNQSVMQSLKQSPFNPKFLEKRDKIHHDINLLQPIVFSTGVAAAAKIEKQFGVQFCLLSGRDRPAPKKEETKMSGPEKPTIVLAGK